MDRRGGAPRLGGAGAGAPPLGPPRPGRGGEPPISGPRARGRPSWPDAARAGGGLDGRRPARRRVPAFVDVEVLVDEEVVGAPEEEVARVGGRRPGALGVEEAGGDAGLADQ